jgi:acyl carrier protein
MHKTTFIEQLKQLIIDAVNLEDVSRDQIDPAAPIFGEGLGLDSIDALEIVVEVEKRYGILIPDIEVGRVALASINALADFISNHQEKEVCRQTE